MFNCDIQLVMILRCIDYWYNSWKIRLSASRFYWHFM